MQLNLLTALLGPLLLVKGTMAAPAPVEPVVNIAAPSESSGEIKWLGLHSYNATRTPEEMAEKQAFLANKALLGKRDSCSVGNNDGIYKPHISNLRHQLQNDDPWSTLFVGASQWTGWYVGNAVVCIYNDYWFDNTHVSRWESGWVTGYIQDMCGYNGDGWTSGGGEATAHGDSGLSLRVLMLNNEKEQCWYYYSARPW
ncbi:hypothetical protein QBC43DRAFT_294811 [Cladorrhinum sp. PSN259]|nr:hypothetical protein QBC43DRAFT_294811 [Cladorrhinum sp. PSN259]